jgi:hypothetical protein
MAGRKFTASRPWASRKAWSHRVIFNISKGRALIDPLGVYEDIHETIFLDRFRSIAGRVRRESHGGSRRGFGAFGSPADDRPDVALCQA